jgi:hypothetical protein
MIRRPLAATALVSMVAVVVTALPAQAKTVSVKQYVNSVCTSLTTFQEDVDDLSQEFQTTVAAQTDLSAVKTEFVTFFDELIGTTQELRSDLKAAGTPKIENGGKIAGALRSGITEMQSLITDAREDANALATDDPAQFTTAAGELSDSLTDAFDELGEGFDDLDEKYDTRKLEAAQDKDPDCSSIS